MQPEDRRTELPNALLGESDGVPDQSEPNGPAMSNRETSSGIKSLVSLQRVSKTFLDGKITALDRVDLDIPEGQWLSVIGKSGSGKSTLLNMIGALDRPTEGSVFFRGQPLDDQFDFDGHRSREIGFVFQSYYLLPNLTACENVQIPMFESKLGTTQRHSRAIELLKSVGLADRADHLPNQLSAGQRQRVAIARSLANQPSMLLADEPTGALDSESSATIIDLLEKVHRDTGITFVVVTHDEAIASRADWQITVKDGRVIDDHIRRDG